MVKSILLAVDGSQFTDPVLQHGIHFAKKLNAQLRVLTVIDVRIFEWAVAIGVEGFAPIIPSTAYQEESQQLLEQKADQILNKVDEILKNTGIKYTLEKQQGNPVDVICDHARLSDMVIMGARGEFAKWSDKMMGATLEAVSRLSVKPICVVQRKFREIKKMLVAYDGSENACKALTLAAFFANTLQTPLTTLTIHPSEEEGLRILNEAHTYLSAYDLPEVKLLRIDGDVVEGIINTANMENADWIVMGSYGHSRIREAILGSHTVQVMRKSPLPILMAR
ncbi:MAG: universal stress protein [Calditrichia bacterium]